MGRDFTFQKVRKFAQGYADYLIKRKAQKILRVIVGYDTRYLSRKFAQETARIFSLRGIHVLLPVRDVPLAAISLAITQRKLDGGVIFTASFDKPDYNGIKVLSNRGVPAPPSVTAMVEREIEAIGADYCFKPRYPEEELISWIHLRAPYIDYLKGIVDFDTIKQAGLKVVVDSLFGASRDYLDYVLNQHDIDVETIHNFSYSNMGGVIPYCSGKTLEALSQQIKEIRGDIGLATDIDGDRFGIIDSDGRYIPSNVIIPPLIEYLITVRKMEGGIVKSVSSTENIYRIAKYYDRKIYTAPVGFKYLAQVLSSRDAFIAVESTNGAALKNEILIKDGILFNLLVLEMLAHHRIKLKDILKVFYKRFPRLHNREITLPATESRLDKFADLLGKKIPDIPGYNVKRVQYIDGIKIFFENTWLLIRKSGTGKGIRVYVEARLQKECADLLRLGRRLIG